MCPADRTALRLRTRLRPFFGDGRHGSLPAAAGVFFKGLLGQGVGMAMLRPRHEGAVSQTMKETVHPVEVVELAELLLKDALQVPAAQRADRIVFAGAGFESRTEPLSLW